MYQFSPPGSSYNITGLVPATTYDVRVRAQTEVGFGHYCCVEEAMTHNGKAQYSNMIMLFHYQCCT